MAFKRSGVQLPSPPLDDKPAKTSTSATRAAVLKCQQGRVSGRDRKQPLACLGRRGGNKSKPSGSPVLHGRFTPCVSRCLGIARPCPPGSSSTTANRSASASTPTVPRRPRRPSPAGTPPPTILDAFYKRMATDPTSLPKPEQILTAQVCDLFLDHSEQHNEQATYLWYKHFLQSFTNRYGRIPARELKSIHVTRWLDAHPDWRGGRRNAVTAVKRAFNWADRQGTLSPTPLRNEEKPPRRSPHPHPDRTAPPDRVTTPCRSGSRPTDSVLARSDHDVPIAPRTIAAAGSRRPAADGSRRGVDAPPGPNLTDAAAFLGVAANTLRLAVEQGRLPGEHPHCPMVRGCSG
jgi:hypothetical protein